MKNLIIAALALLPFNLQGNSQHNKYTNTIYCKSDSDCWHEIGHLMDDRTGHPSQSAEFGGAVAIYIYVTIPQLQGKLDPFTEVIFTQSGMFQYDTSFSTPSAVHAVLQSRSEVQGAARLPDVFKRSIVRIGVTY